MATVEGIKLDSVLGELARIKIEEAERMSQEKVTEWIETRVRKLERQH